MPPQHHCGEPVTGLLPVQFDHFGANRALYKPRKSSLMLDAKPYTIWTEYKGIKFHCSSSTTAALRLSLLQALTFLVHSITFILWLSHLLANPSISLSLPRPHPSYVNVCDDSDKKAIVFTTVTVCWPTKQTHMSHIRHQLARRTERQPAGLHRVMSFAASTQPGPEKCPAAESPAGPHAALGCTAGKKAAFAESLARNNSRRLIPHKE